MKKTETRQLNQTDKQEALKITDDLLDFIAKSPTAWQAVRVMVDRLEKIGFKPMDKAGDLKPGDLVYVTPNHSALLAFRVGSEPLEHGMKIFGAHTDSPALRIKPNSVSESCGEIRLTTEVYGGPILNTWFDRPLSLAGRVFVKTDDPMKPEVHYVDFEEPILILPNVAIHMNRQVNDGVKIERHKVLLPFLGNATDEADQHKLLLKLIADKIDVDADSILSYDLLTYEVEKGRVCGVNKDYVSCSRLDNLAMCFAGIDAFEQTEPGKGLDVLIFTDNEEVGSGSKQGADSMAARDAIEAVLVRLGADRKTFLNLFADSYMISADLAHAVHPNYSEYADPDHRPRINGGPAIKLAASQSYATDGESEAIFRALCAKADIPCQIFVNRSDLRGGSTIGPITSAWIPVRTVDIGTAVWGMHSVRETGGVNDMLYMRRLLTEYFG